MFIQTAFLRILRQTCSALAFFYSSVPLFPPQNPSLLLWQCFSRPLPPTVSLLTLLRRLASSIPITWFGRLKPSSSNFGDGHAISCEPTVFLMPNMVKMPRVPSRVISFLRSKSA